MNNAGHLNNGSSATFMPYPFAIQNQSQHPPLMEQSYINATTSYVQSRPPRLYNPRPPVPAPKSEKRKQEILTCDACGIEVNSQQMMDAHIRGQKHIKKMKLKAASTATSSAANSSASFTANADASSTSSTISSDNSTAQSTLTIESNAAVTTGPKPLTSYNEKSILQLMNELAKFNKVSIKYDLIKESGPAHCKQFEVQLTVADETYIGVGTSIKRAQQIAAEKALATTALKKPEASQRGSHSTRVPRPPIARAAHSNVRHQYPPRQKPYSAVNHSKPNSSNNDNLLQNLINDKCAEVTETDSTINKIQGLVDEIERALKIVSDKIMEQCKQNNIVVVPQLPENVKLNNKDQLNDDTTESFRMLKGAMKVSSLAMRLFYKHDYEYSLVVICANKPTVTLLNEVCQELTIGLNAQAIAALQLNANDEQSTPITYQVQACVNDAYLTVQTNILPDHTIRILFTSPVFRSENFLNLADNHCEQIAELNPDPSDMLDKNKCLEAAAEMRHSNWFSCCMLEQSQNLAVLRVLRDLQFNLTPLSYLNLWCLALLVYKCQIQPPTSSTSLLRSVFSCLSSGVLLPNNIGPGIIDPCEKDPVDAAAYLSLQQRLDITAYAQNILRLISLEKYEALFHMNSNPNEQISMNITIEEQSLSQDYA